MAGLVSVVIPVYNHAEELTQALLSIQKQTYPLIEIIVIDDGSREPIEGMDKSIRCIWQENAGAPAARNRGLQASRGEYVIFWDADVIALSETMIADMVASLEHHPETDIAYSDFLFGKKHMPAQVWRVEALHKNNFIHSTSLIRKSALDGITWDETLKRFQDWDLWLQLAAKGKSGIWIPETLFQVAPRKTGMSTWLPSFAYKKPWKYIPGIASRVRAYEEAKRVVEEKHGTRSMKHEA